MNLKIRIILVLSVFFIFGSCQEETLVDDIRLSKIYSGGSLFLEYFYDQDGLNYLVHSYAYYDGGNNISTINEYDYDSEGRPLHRSFTNLTNDNDSESDYYYNEVTGFIDSIVIFENGTKKKVHRYYFSDRRIETRRFYVYEDQPNREYDRIIRLLDGKNEVTERVWYQFDEEDGNIRWSDSSHYEYDSFNAPFVGNILTGMPHSKHNILNITSYKTLYSTGKVDTVFQEFEYSYNEDLFPTKKVHLTMGGYDEYEYINLNE